MEIWQSLVIGTLQGITEIFPVSSSGHVEIARLLMGFGAEDLTYFIWCLSFGVLIALTIYFRKSIARIFTDTFIRQRPQTAINVLTTCLTAGAAGWLFSQIFLGDGFDSNQLSLAVMIGLVGIVMIFVDRLPHASQLTNETKLTKPRALGIGLAQFCAGVPGISFAAPAMLAGRFAGLDNKSSAKYAFLSAIPLIFGFCLGILLTSSTRDYLFNNFGILALSNLAVIFFGLITLALLMRYLAKPKSLQTFGIYRLAVALIIIAFMLIA